MFYFLVASQLSKMESIMDNGVNSSVVEFLEQAVNEYHNNVGNFTFLHFNKSFGVIAIDPNIMLLPILEPSIGYMFSSEVFSVPQACVYPISGSYGFLNRLLYYCLLIFALLVRHHSWLCPAALVSAMTYSSVACVHAFALLMYLC